MVPAVVAHVCLDVQDPCAFTTVTAALASGADEIVVHEGVWNEEATLRITRSVTVRGTGPVSLTASGPGPVFLVGLAGRLTLVDLTVAKLGGRVLESYGGRVTADRCSFYGIGLSDGGAVMELHDGSLVVSESAFLDSVTGGDGGHLLLDNVGTLVWGSTFQGGSARNGGAIHVTGPASVVLVENSYVDNTAFDAGGALSVAGGAVVRVVGGRFEGNLAEEGGALATVGDSPTLTVENARVEGNRAARGGGISHHFGKLGVDGSTFEGNVATSAAGVLASASTLVTGTTFCANHADQDGGVANLVGGNHRWTHDRLLSNDAPTHGALFTRSSLVLEHSFLLGNSGANGAALDVQEALAPAIAGSSVVSHSNVYAFSSGGIAVDLRGVASAELVRDLFWSNVGGDTEASVTEPVVGDPMFRAFAPGLACDAIDDRYALRSPLVDAGTGVPDPDGTPPDVGAYGALETEHPWWDDLDGDGVPQLYDCNEEDPTIYPVRAGDPGFREVWYDGIDQACDGGSDYDRDLDGYERDVATHPVDPSVRDCDDADPSVNPGSVDAPGRDGDCDGDVDADRDGVGTPEDCDDEDASIRPGSVEDASLERDTNCDGVVEPEGVLVPQSCSVVPGAVGPSTNRAGTREATTASVWAALAVAVVATRRRARGGSCRA